MIYEVTHTSLTGVGLFCTSLNNSGDRSFLQMLTSGGCFHVCLFMGEITDKSLHG